MQGSYSPPTVDPLQTLPLWVSLKDLEMGSSWVTWVGPKPTGKGT